MKNIPLIRKIKEKEYMNVWVRHGEKFKEIKLIPTDLYESSVKLYFSM